ncbi:MAG TPA: c-type cytochrome [Gemmatimonadaceae bacterium]|nr:c-type cytochrome [Gemmatimonadaceae bacterium]
MRILAVVVGILVAVVAAIYLRSVAVLGHRFTSPPVTIQAATDPARIAHGQHLASVACAGCHGPDYGGQLFIDGMPFMKLYTPNLTRGQGGAAATFTDRDFEAAIRHGYLPGGRSLLVMPSEVFGNLADDDLEDVIAALRAAPPVDRRTPLPAIGPVGRALTGLGIAKIRAAELAAVLPTPPAKAPPVARSVEYGHYLTLIGGCVNCHGPGLSGGLIPNMGPNKKIAANITPTGLASYNDSLFTRALRQGIRPDRTPIDTFMPWRHFRLMSDTEIGALYTYLRTVPARPFGNR